MNKVLEKLKQENILCEIYENLDETDKFYVGYILNVDDDTFIFESVSSDGKHDGFYCTFIDSIIQIKYKTKYLANIEKLMAHNDFKRSNLELDENGKEDGTGIAKISDISCVSTGTEELQKLKIWE